MQVTLQTAWLAAKGNWDDIEKEIEENFATEVNEWDISSIP